ncbi:hypothetical protein LUW74_33380 [Actinomadura madurae]|uniref:hypothetical protein n=1 Tax=Actinomadura madurae TaxID=1993 RepID=UPI002027602E|nr:hypothetical protein [Actinomadura madurae]URN07777.1 hypothetical protein LUW74_33380 [Actinomadura madurae]
MRSLPIQRGAIRPQDRRRYAIVPVLARVAAVAGFAFAGWIALSALTETAFAAEPAPRPQQAVHDAVFGEGAMEPDDLSTFRHLSPGHGRDAADPAESLSGDLREAGDEPVEYLGSRKRDVLDDKDRAVQRIEELTAAAGVPRLPAPEVRPDRPVIGGLVQQVTGPEHAAPEHAAPADAGARPGEDADAGHASDKGGPATARAGHTSAPETFAGAAPDGDGGRCAACRGGDRAPVRDPALPSGQDGPRSTGSGGGHPFVPFADLLTRQYPAAPSAADAGTFHRTALSDVAAPGGPSVVPD